MRVVCLSTGAVRSKRGERGVRRYVVPDWDEPLPVNAFLVEHPAGLCVFDAGQTSDAAAPGYFPAWHPFFRLSRFELGPDDELGPQLAASGWSPGDVRWVVLSHLHTDHVGCLPSFPDASVLVSRIEWERARGLRGKLRGYLPDRVPESLRLELVALDGPPVGPFAGSHDVAGDGRLVLVAAPGHTPGHMALLVEADGARYLLGGDAAHSAAALADEAPEIAAFCRAQQITFLAAHDPRAAELTA
jgi:N-acyl homoserine lactone hydrolase